jgi:hypothetical protein
MTTLKEELIIMSNIPTGIQKEMNENPKFRELMLEKYGYIKYKNLKEAVLKYRKEYIEQGFVSIEAYDLIFGDFEK